MHKPTRTRFRLHWWRGIEMDTESSKTLIHYIGAAVVICAIALLVRAIAPNGFF